MSQLRGHPKIHFRTDSRIGPVTSAIPSPSSLTDIRNFVFTYLNCFIEVNTNLQLPQWKERAVRWTCPAHRTLTFYCVHCFIGALSGTQKFNKHAGSIVNSKNLFLCHFSLCLTLSSIKTLQNMTRYSLNNFGLEIYIQMQRPNL